MTIPGDGETGDIFPEDIGASLAEIFEAETGEHADPVAERIARRSRLADYYDAAVNARATHAPREVQKRRGKTVLKYGDGQDPREYETAGYRRAGRAVQ